MCENTIKPNNRAREKRNEATTQATKGERQKAGRIEGQAGDAGGRAVKVFYEPPTVRFGKLSPGDIFRFTDGECLWMKIGEDKPWNNVAVTDGTPGWVPLETNVRPVDCELVVKS